MRRLVGLGGAMRVNMRRPFHVLRTQIAKLPAQKLYMSSNIGGTLTLKTIKKIDNPYVFCDKEGRPFGNVRRSFSTALKKAGIEDFRFHDLRHTFASHS